MPSPKILYAVAISVVLLAVSAVAHADETSKSAKVAELMKAEGLYETLEIQRGACKAQFEALRPRLVKQFKDADPDFPDDFWPRLDAIIEKYGESLKPAFTTQEAVDSFGKLYGAELTEGDLDQMLAYYKSPIGQKDVLTSRKVLPAWTSSLMQKNQVVLEKSLKSLMSDLKQAAAECRNSIAHHEKSCSAAGKAT